MHVLTAHSYPDRCGHSLAAVAASVHGSASGVSGRAGVAAAAFAGLSIARGGGPSEVRFGMHIAAHAMHMHAHLTTYQSLLTRP